MRFRVLGPVEAWRDGQRLDLGTRQQRFVLAVLLLDANRVVPTTRLIELLWPDGPPRSVRHALQVRVSRLRAILGETVPVVGDGDGYRIEVDPACVDIHLFRSLVVQGREAEGRGADADAVGLYRQALDLWAGQPLAGAAPDDVRETLCHSLDEARLVALEDCLDAELRLGRATTVLDELTNLAGAHPTRERLVGQLMLALHRSGQTARALEIAHSTREHLAEQLGIDPGTELQALTIAILRDDPTLAAPAPSATAAAAAVPPPAERPPIPAQLPLAVSRFAGRTSELRVLDGLVSGAEQSADESRVVALTGMGGVGKTTLAVRWAHSVADQFPDGRLFLDLHGYAPGPAMSAVEALAQLLRALGLEPDAVPTEADAAAAAYRTALANRAVLVVLDNAADAEQVRPLLPGNPACLTLVTSRDRLSGLVVKDGARRIAVDTLTPSEATDLLETLLGPARAVAEPEAVATIASLCARLPLALRIAAGYLLDNPTQSVESYVDELTAGDLLDEFAVAGDDDSAVRAAFDLSYRRLDAADARLFRLLGLVPGADFAAGAAEALAGMSTRDARRALRRLTAQHLLVESGAGRYSFHDLLRHYARHAADADESPETRGEAFERLLAWYYFNSRRASTVLAPGAVTFAPPIEPPGVPAVVGVEDVATATGWFEAEHDNQVAAIIHTAEHGPYAWAWLLAEVIRHDQSLRSLYPEWLASSRAALEAARHSSDPEVQASVHLGHGRAVWYRDPRRALDLYRVALQHSQAAGKWTRVNACLVSIGILQYSLGDFVDAQIQLRRALEVTRPGGSRRNEAINLTQLSMVCLHTADLPRSTGHLDRAIALFEAGGDRRYLAHALVHRAYAASSLGQPNDALQFLDRASRLASEAANPRIIVDAINDRAMLCAELGRLDEAAELVREALAGMRSIRDLESEATVRIASGMVSFRLGHLDRALAEYSRALSAAVDAPDRRLQIDAMVGLAEVDAALGHLDTALARAGEAASLAQASGAFVAEARALTVQAGIEHRLGRSPDAVDHARRSVDMHRQSRHHLGLARALTALATASACGHAADDDVQQLLDEALELFAAFGAPEARILAGPHRPR